MQTIMPPVSTPDNLFHDGDPTQGIEGTIVPAGHLNNEQGAIRDVQQELINVLALAAMEPDHAKQDQLATAIQAIIGNAIPTIPVTSVNTKTGAVVLGAADVGALATANYHPRTDSLTSQQGDIPLIKNKDMNTCLAGEFGLYEKATCTNSPPGAGSYFYCETKSIYTTASLIQIAWTYDGAGVLAWRNYSQNTHAWDAVWREGYDTGHKPTAADVGAAPLAHTHPGSALSPLTLGTEDLDGIITPGFYIQGSDASTSTASHYPELQAGSLRVEEGAGPKQTYHVYNSTRVWTRAKYQAEAWTPWAREYNTQNKPTPADIGAAPASHTHTPASIGAAPASHTHTPASIGAAYTMRPFTNGGNITGFTQCTVSLVRGGRIYPLTFAIPSATTSFWIVNRGGENADKDYDFGVTCTRSGSNMALTVVGSGPTLSTIYVM